MAGSTQLVFDTGDSMIKASGPDEAAGIVTHATIVGDGRMIGYFTRRGCAVMTGLAGGCNSTVVENDG